MPRGCNESTTLAEGLRARRVSNDKLAGKSVVAAKGTKGTNLEHITSTRFVTSARIVVS